MSMDGMTMEDKCEQLEPCGMHFVRVYVRRVIHVFVHNGLTDVGSVLVVVHTFS